LNRPKLLYFVTEDWYFCSHRLPLALAAQKAGYEVTVVTNVNRHGEAIRRSGFRLIPLNLSRRGMNLFSEIMVLARLIMIYQREKPDIVNHVAMKPVLYGSIAARISGVPNVLNMLAGLGYVFTSKSLMARCFLRPVIGRAFRRILENPRSRLILQNQDDREMFIRNRFINKDQIRLIKGSGVDTSVFLPTPEPQGVPVIILASRMLWAKGVMAFVEAARQLKSSGNEGRFILVGDTDGHNPSAIPEEQLNDWHSEGVIEWWGHREDMPRVFSKSHIICLPSFYGEGVPKVLIEAAACGRPIITTNMPGCREIVKDGENGLLISAHNAKELTNAIRILIENPELRQKMGARGREIAMGEFTVEKVVSQTLKVYEELLKQ
jgi:glycosyltransferase involved in cell wall biosynthesis